VFERRQRLAMLDLSLFRIGAFTGANIVAMLVSLSMFGVFFFVTLYVQNILRYSPAKAGATFLPMVLLIIFVAPIAGRLSDRIGSRWLMGGGMTLLGISLLLYERVTVHSNFWTLLPPMLVGGFGMAMTMSPMTSAAMGAVPVDKAGVGSGMLNSFRQVGGSLGIALMGAIVGSYLHHPAGSPAAAQDYVNGLHSGFEVGAAITFVAAIVAVALVRTRPEVVREHLAEIAA
jgi:MFS family permease